MFILLLCGKHANVRFSSFKKSINSTEVSCLKNAFILSSLETFKTQT